MQWVYSVSDMRKAEQNAFTAGTSSRKLMTMAAEAVVSHLVSCREPYAILCGKGNNAGDGYAIAMLLASQGLSCTVFRISDTVSDDSQYFLSRCQDLGIPVIPYSADICLSSYGTLVDCLFGIGYHDPMPADYMEVIDHINRSHVYTVSVDIASGLNADNGTGYPVRADLTVSIDKLKSGHFLNQGKDYSGNIVNHDIGLQIKSCSMALFGPEDLPEILLHRNHLSNKSTYGYIGLVGGCSRYQGALRLADLAAGAMRSGAGVVRLGFPRNMLNIVAQGTLESTLFPFTCDNDGNLVFSEDEFREYIRGLKAIAFGMGIGVSEESKKALLFLLHEYHGILIIDADGLNLLSMLDPEETGHFSCRLVLTPHLLEFSRLCGLTVPEIQKQLPAIAQEYAKKHSVTLLLKGPTTIITDGSFCWLVNRGCPGMATAGSGDVLSGITAALCGACGDDILRAVSASAWLNGAAGEAAQTKYGAASMISGDTARMIPELILSLQQ